MSSIGDSFRERVIVYIDGFNLYFGLNEKGWRHYLWLDLPALATKLVRTDQQLMAVKYFTTRVGDPAESVRRQSTYLDALGVRGGVEIIYGKFNYAPDGCDHCGKEWTNREEKQTDVKIAVHMLRDAYNRAFDMALLVSGDSDLVPVVDEIEGEHDGQRVVVAFPPRRVSGELKAAASASLVLGRTVFKGSQLPQMVPGNDGVMLCQPVEWWRDEGSVT